jgi:hypothetical protein
MTIASKQTLGYIIIVDATGEGTDWFAAAIS